MNVQQILNKVDNIETGVNYWFVRTNQGKDYASFTKGGYIAIGWDYISLGEVLEGNKEKLRAKIMKQEKFDPSKTKDKIRITSAYNKITTFSKLKKGDIVVVPSQGSDRLSFGRIDDDIPYGEGGDLSEVPNFKRRRVEWITTQNIRNLPAIFYQVKSNHHTISNIDRFAPFIDKIVGNLFKKDDKTHFVLNIEQEGDIAFEDVKGLMESIDLLIRDINEELNFNDNLEDFIVKINLQSKGTIELIKPGKALAILAFLLSLVSCGKLDDANNDPAIQNLIDKNRASLNQTGEKIEKMKVNTKELTKPFGHGK